MATSAKKLHEDAVALFREEDYDSAIEVFEAALESAADDPNRQALIYNDMGVTHKQLDDYSAAHTALDKAVELFEAQEDYKGLAQTVGNRAMVYEAEGELEDAVEHYRASAAKLEELGENEAAMYVWQALSRLRLKEKQYIAAIGAYEEGIENMPQGSFKRKVLQKLLKLPTNLINRGGQ
ncbi:tetratricopeptide repeat protein [Anaerolineales bacterium HSG6]|nr:tetratricopeptide repeat protein [Anaerolineales bacterium HSG6]MDM8531668.1 tetratricopeptide repeat protein [Anaerolineales bacterium HSG25]